MNVHKDKVEVGCIQLDIFCRDPYGKSIHIRVFYSSAFWYN